MLADVPRADPNQPAAWSRNGVILFGCPCGLDSVPAAGGPVTTIRKTDGEIAYAAPQFLPGGDRFLYLVASDDPKAQGVYASSLSAPSQRTLIVKTEGKALYVAPRADRPGHLLWLEGQTLHARPFDAERLQWTGEPISLAEGIAVMNTRPVRSAFWASDAGMLLYSTAPPLVRKLPLVWTGRDGRPLGDAAPEGPYNAIAMSRDGERAARTRLGSRGPATGTATSGSGTSRAAPTLASHSERRPTRTRCGPPSDGESRSRPTGTAGSISCIGRTRPGPARRSASPSATSTWIPSTGVPTAATSSTDR